MSVSYDGFPNGITDDYLRHAVSAPGQYDSTCRALAAEVLRLRQALNESAADIDRLCSSIERAASWESAGHLRNRALYQLRGIARRAAAERGGQ